MFGRARQHIRELNLETLPFHHQLLYELIRVADGLEAGELHDRYDAVADQAYLGRGLTPISKRARRTKLSKLVEYDLVEVDGKNRHRRYHVYDAQIKSQTSVGILFCCQFSFLKIELYEIHIR